MNLTQRGTDLNTSNFATTWTINKPPYVILKWSIENFSSAQSLITSPCFDISRTSKWNLLLDPTVVVNGDIFVAFYLRRDPRCPQPMTLRLTGEFSVHGPLNELIYDKVFEEVYDSSLNDNIEFRIAKVCFSASSCDWDMRNTYLARCEMLISEQMRSLNEWRPHLEKLSSDYQRLYQESKFTDTIIRASDDVISAHKAILFARSPALSQILEVSRNRISENEKNAILGPVLLFIYSGNPDLLLDSIPVEMFGHVALVASKWKMNDLENILTPVKMHCKTRIKFGEFLYTFQVKNFSKLPWDARDCFHTADFGICEDTNSRWKLIIENNLAENNEAYGLYLAKLHPDNVSHEVGVEFYMKNSRGNCIATKKGEYTFGPRNVQKFGFSSFSNKDYLQSRILEDDILNIECRMKVRFKTESWIHFQAKHADFSDEDPHSLKYFKTLSRNFKDLYKSTKGFDLKLFTVDEELVAHRAILWARSPYFSEELSRSSAEYLNVPIESSTMKKLLLYMYSAKIPTLDSEISIKLYRACKFLRLMDLWNVCRRFIFRNINVGIVLDVIGLAHEYSDTELEREAIAFVCIRENAKMIIATERWTIFCRNYMELALHIYHKLTLEYCNHVCRI